MWDKPLLVSHDGLAQPNAVLSHNRVINHTWRLPHRAEAEISLRMVIPAVAEGPASDVQTRRRFPIYFPPPGSANVWVWAGPLCQGLSHHSEAGEENSFRFFVLVRLTWLSLIFQFQQRVKLTGVKLTRWSSNNGSRNSQSWVLIVLVFLK